MQDPLRELQAFTIASLVPRHKLSGAPGEYHRALIARVFTRDAQMQHSLFVVDTPHDIAAAYEAWCSANCKLEHVINHAMFDEARGLALIDVTEDFAFWWLPFVPLRARVFAYFHLTSESPPSQPVRWRVRLQVDHVDAFSVVAAWPLVGSAYDVFRRCAGVVLSRGWRTIRCAQNKVGAALRRGLAFCTRTTGAV